MCELATIATVAGGSALISGGISAVSTYQQGQYQAKVAENSARVARWNRADALARGAEAAGRVRTIGSRASGAALARMAASNIDTTTGSPAGSLAATEANVQADVDAVRANAARQAWSLTNEAQDLHASARMARRGSILGAFGAGLGGVGQAAGTFASYNK
jgi:hypothetical protein